MLSCTSILDGQVQPGEVIVIRYEGPKGGPGMREMLTPTSAIVGAGLGSDVALLNGMMHVIIKNGWHG